jgi:hypothetical protein
VHTEEIRVRLAARKFRSKLVAVEPTPAEAVLSAADKYFNFARVILPSSDPLLCGSHAILDRAFSTIWMSQDRPISARTADAAHEYGHMILHDTGSDVSSDEFVESVAGYSKNQRDEVDAHRFAAEFLLPLPLATSMFNEGACARAIGHQLGIPRRLVLRQLSLACSNDQSLIDNTPNATHLFDSWQRDAAQAISPALVIGASGTGKTTSLIARCQYLLGDSAIPASKILILCHSSGESARVRISLSSSPGISSALIPIATVYQFAYDILVRYAEHAGLLRGWEEQPISRRMNLSADKYPEVALELLRRHPDVCVALRDRYQHLLIDDIDIMPLLSQQLLHAVIRYDGGGYWATSSVNLHQDESRRPYASSEFYPNNCRRYALAFQYRSAPSIYGFANGLTHQAIKKAVCRRPESERTSSGTVTVAMFAKTEQLVTGVKQYWKDKESSGFVKRDIMVLSGGTGGSFDDFISGIISRTKQVRKLNELQCKEAMLYAIVDLCGGQQGRAPFLCAGRLPRYNVSRSELIQHAERLGNAVGLTGSPHSQGLSRLLIDVSNCSGSKSPRHILEEYLFEQTDLLRENPEFGEAARTVMLDLIQKEKNFRSGGTDNLKNLLHLCANPAQNSRRQRHNQSTSSLRGLSVPVVIVADANFDDRYEGSVADIINACGAASEHLLICVEVVDNAPPIRLRQSLRSHHEAAIQDWRTIQSSAALENRMEEARRVRLSNEEKALFRQCPRRLYYKRLLDPDAQTPNRRDSSAGETPDFPASPADSALCVDCSYNDICPLNLD